MVGRPHWVKRIHAALRQAPIAWLTGVRRVGKTTLVKELGDVEYFNCDLLLAEELTAFGVPSLERRLLHGGLPEALLAKTPPDDFFRTSDLPPAPR